MSRNSRLALIVLSIFIIFGCTKQFETTTVKQKVNYQEDLYVLLALDSEHQKQYGNSYEYYKRLYQLTPSLDYMVKMISYSYKLKKFEEMLILSKEALEKFPTKKEYFLKQTIIANLGLKKVNIALERSLDLLKEFNTANNYAIVANTYYALGDYKNSLKYYESSYALNQNENTLVKLTTVLYSYLNQKDVALAYLETYLQTKGCSAKVCDKLMLIYQEQGNIDGMLSILNKMYTKYSQTKALKKTALMIQNIIVSLLEKKDIKEAIKYLEKNKINQVKLLNFYEKDGQIKKALKLTRELYKKTRNPELLGRIAMFQFESAKNKKKVMKHVIANFELALSSGINNASYQNYYGYLLIDFEINVKKGVNLVKAALKTAPTNLAYLDSLAWGYYKMGKCDDALEVMSSIILKTGLNDKEIKSHWDKIKNCKKTKKNIRGKKKK